MNAKVYEYRTLINNLRRVSREIDVILNQINRYESLILSGLAVNDNISFDGELKDLKEKLTYKKNKIVNVIIPGLNTEMEMAMVAE